MRRWKTVGLVLLANQEQRVFEFQIKKRKNPDEYLTRVKRCNALQLFERDKYEKLYASNLDENKNF